MEKIQKISRDLFLPFQPRIEEIFKKMDYEYDIAANQYGFNCRGCEDNCCLTRFYHHTLLEYLYLREGYRYLSEDIKKKITASAKQVVNKYNRSQDQIRVMCPLNSKGLCILYKHRPMICRLHGIPNELRRPDQKIIQGPGCDEFTKKHGKKPYASFNRTPFYIEMAQTEKELKNALEISVKFKQTVAEMILSFEEKAL